MATKTSRPQAESGAMKKRGRNLNKPSLLTQGNVSPDLTKKEDLTKPGM